ncbi:MAG: FAD-binding protein [Spirochaetaceae bacterium]|jgi:succinate dehydrogenase/fumarate reductase flavoprotein subunit|nr:FAD-binding protein [Spirochaetaceae bacterium]
MKKFFRGLGIMLLAALAGCSSSQVAYVDTIPWDAEFDVVVIGFGGAGASASIAAAEAGARVLLTEKAPLGHEGGNSRYSYQLVRNYGSYEAGIAYVKAESAGFDHMTDEIIDFIVRGSMENAVWLESVGLAPINRVMKPLGEYPEFPGANQVFMDLVTDPDLASEKPYWANLRKGVVDRQDKISVWFEAPAKHLIQDPFTKTIVGVQIEKEGQMLNVRAKNGVVMACGGFENNETMIEYYTQREHLYPMGTLYNTGDGIRMALEVGADLWHMNALSGPFITVKAPGMEIAYFARKTSMVQSLAAGGGVIIVGKDGTRFMTESEVTRHGHIYYSGNFYSQITPDPMWMIFDENARRAGFDLPPQFSPDLSAEIASGLVVQANTIAELARKIGVQVDSPIPNSSPISTFRLNNWDQTYRTVGLVNQVNAYNQYCANNFDPQFNRKPETMAPINRPPYYALQLQPAMVNTQGGARRNIKCEILDPFGKPIPHLYGAGEFGSFYGGNYTAGGNVAETMFSGRTAGTNAALPKPTLEPLSLARAASQLRSFPNEIAQQKQIALGTNEYLGVATGMGGEVVVKIRIDGTRIAEVEVVSHNETQGLSDPAIEQIPQAIVTANTPTVDVVAGASITSRAIMNAVKDAQAKIK